MSWIDAGINLTDKKFAAVDQLISDARAAEVNYLLAIATTLEDSRRLQSLSSAHANIMVTAGIHPHNAKDALLTDYDEIEQLGRDRKVVAIGECGLDFNRNFSPENCQIECFERQLDIAARVKMPVYLHEREAFDVQYRLLTRYIDRIPNALVHCFTGDQSQLEKYLELGCYIGITGWITDKKRGNSLRNAAPSIPLSRLILETDAPYLTPKNIKPRPKYCRPAHIPAIAQEFSDITGIPLEDIRQHSTLNAEKLFNQTLR